MGTSSGRGGLIDWQDAPRGWQNTPKIILLNFVNTLSVRATAALLKGFPVRHQRDIRQGGVFSQTLGVLGKSKERLSADTGHIKDEQKFVDVTLFLGIDNVPISFEVTRIV